MKYCWRCILWSILVHEGSFSSEIEMKRKGKLAKRYTKSLGMVKYVNYNQCETWSLDKGFQTTALLQCRYPLIPTWTTSGSFTETYLGIVFCFELLKWSFLQKMALLVTDLVMKVQPHRNNLLLFYYLEGRLDISILLVEWSSFWISFCTLKLGIFVSMSPAGIISRLLSFLLLRHPPHRRPCQLQPLERFLSPSQLYHNPDHFQRVKSAGFIPKSF